MGTTVQLVTEPLYRKQLREKLIEAGFTTQILKVNEDNVNVCNLSDKIYIVQAHMWPDVRHMLKNSMSVVMFGTLSWFYCWFKAKPKHVSAYMTPLDSLDTMMSSLEQVLQENHYLSDTVRNLLAKEHQVRQEQLLNTNVSSCLTESELEVLTLIGEGYTTSEIAEKRFRSVHTIKTQRKRVRNKIDTVNGERLAVFAGRKVYALKTLLSIEQHTEELDKICKNTP